jgi:hypothetical protein
MIKRRQSAHVTARTYHSQCRDLRPPRPVFDLLVLTHNIMIPVVVGEQTKVSNRIETDAYSLSR